MNASEMNITWIGSQSIASPRHTRRRNHFVMYLVENLCMKHQCKQKMTGSVDAPHEKTMSVLSSSLGGDT